MFDNNQVTNEIEAYILGFLYADGCITDYSYDKYRVLSIALSQIDKDYLQQLCDIFNNELGKQYTIKHSQNTCSYRLTIANTVLIQNLIKLGITHQKTYENSSFVFDNVPTHLKQHFIRGYFDGDGTIGIYKNKCQIGFVSLNQKLLQSILDYLHNDLNFNFGKLRLDAKCYRLCLAGNVSCKTFADWLYENATIYMQRKYDIAQQIKPQPQKLYHHLNWYKHNQKWGISIRHNNHKEYLGCFPTIKECIEIYNKKAIEYGLPIQIYKGEYNNE